MKKVKKRKCTKCNTLFFDFGKYPIVCPNCGADVNSLLTNVSRRGRPPKNVKPESPPDEKDMKIDELKVEESAEEVVSSEQDVEEIVEIERDQES